MKIKTISHTEGILNWIFCDNKKLPAEAKKMQDVLLKIPFGHSALKADSIRRIVPIDDNLLEQYQKRVEKYCRDGNRRNFIQPPNSLWVSVKVGQKNTSGGEEQL